MKNTNKPSDLTKEDIAHLAKVFDWLLKADMEQNSDLYKKVPMHEKGPYGSMKTKE